MVFSSLSFLCFFLPLVILLYFAGSSVKWKNGVLLVFSLVFYGWSGPKWLVAMLASTLLNYVCARNIALTEKQSAKRFHLVLSLIGSLGLLFYFKYCAFAVNSIMSLLGVTWRMTDRILPVGISFYTFQILSYTLDVYWDKTPVQKNPLTLLLYVCCFPQLIAGPIVKYDDIEKKLNKRYTSPDDFQAGMRRFAVGLGKKVLLANVAGMALEETVLAGSGQLMSVCGAWLSAFLYALQIYFDFSAYSDMAIGLGRVFGFTYKENFDYPYLSQSAGEFFRRWHISLGTWFREYLMYPLLRSGWMRKLSMKKSDRHSKMYYRNLATAICTMIVWATTGLWHGANWNFVAWGTYYGIMMLLEKFVFGKILDKTPGFIKWFLTGIIVLVGYVIFYYTDFTNVITHILAMIGIGRTASGISAAPFTDAATVNVFKNYAVFMGIAVIGCLPVKNLLDKIFIGKKSRACLNALGTVFLSAVVVLSVLFLVGQSYNPFIYFRF